MDQKNKSYLGISTNIGDLKKNIETATEHLKELGEILEISSHYKTEPVGYKNQDWFINICLLLETSLTPQELIKETLKIEEKMGRERKIKNGPRIIDIDILFYEQNTVKFPTLTIPHPFIQERNFVLTPLAEIAPEFIHPILNKSIKQLKEELNNPDQVIKI